MSPQSGLTPSGKRDVRRVEKQIQRSLQTLLNGEIEVSCPAGRIDLLTMTEVIEIKIVNKWKSAIGQVLTYGNYYPSRDKRIHLFGKAGIRTKQLVEIHCARFDIRVTWEDID